MLIYFCLFKIVKVKYIKYFYFIKVMSTPIGFNPKIKNQGPLPALAPMTIPASTKPKITNTVIVNVRKFGY